MADESDLVSRSALSAKSRFSKAVSKSLSKSGVEDVSLINSGRSVSK
jgi:hypothetical protein